ncbi:MAG TPA: hypothetical protein VFC78_14380 [Tepidisphaeraceae bacterium]|nr:hypothetical protein [Tepidisphaeraceae bacterium]
MATLTIPEPTLARLKAIAAARKLSLDDYLRELAATNAPADSARQLAALESFAQGMTQWTTKNLPRGHRVDDSRATIYEGRGE